MGEGLLPTPASVTTFADLVLGATSRERWRYPFPYHPPRGEVTSSLPLSSGHVGEGESGTLRHELPGRRSGSLVVVVMLAVHLVVVVMLAFHFVVMVHLRRVGGGRYFSDPEPEAARQSVAVLGQVLPGHAVGSPAQAWAQADRQSFLVVR